MATLAVALVALTISGVSALAGPPQTGPTAHHSRGGHALPITGTIPRALAHGTRDGREDGARQLTLAISLQPQHRAVLDQLILDQQNPKSSNYHKYLSPQAFTDQFGASADAVTAVRAFLQDAGIHVTGVAANRLQINATGTVAQAERAFKITISQYQLNGRTVYAPDGPPFVPDTLAASIMNISGLHNVALYHPLAQRAQQSPALPNTGPAGGFDPTELRGAYDVASLISGGGTGSGQRVAVFELAPYIPGDLSAYRTNYSLPASTVNNHAIDSAAVTCATGGTTCDIAGVGEADLDLEVVSALAPNATQDVYTGPNTDQGVLDTYQAIATDNVAKVITTSWGLCEPFAGTAQLQAQDTIFAQMAAQGQTIYAASGDRGSDDCVVNSGGPTVDSPASDPYVVGVGGTSLTLAAGPTYGSEVTWNSSGTPHNRPIASGGGNSSYFRRPSWQLEENMPNQFVPVRLVPDVSADADPFTGYSVYCTSLPDCTGVGWLVFGGTSAAAPLWAAITADTNTYLVANSKPTVGWINSTLYQLAANLQTNTPFHDVTLGNNQVNTVTGFNAGQCYDQTTGIGTPDAWNIARDLAGGVHTAGGGPCPVSGNTTTNLVQNGGFEATAPVYWQQFSQGGIPVIVAAHPFAGSNAFIACGYPSCDDRVQQSIVIPGAVTTATLSFELDAASSLQQTTPSLACLDHFTVTLAAPDGTVLETLLAQCATNTNGYVLVSINVLAALQAHLNQYLVLMIRGVASGLAGDAGFSSVWAVDNVALTVS
jgi:kumamolisin